jgi:hypothetical protein
VGMVVAAALTFAIFTVALWRRASQE